MQKMLRKKIIFVMIFFAALVLMPNIVNAADNYNATAVINGVTANLEYELNDSNQVINLKCLNANELTGSVTIPAVVDEKTVVSIGKEGFKLASGITEITIPDSVKTIEFKAFSHCTNLNKINFGNGVEKIGDYAFEGCTSLTSLKIPKSIKSKSGSIQGVFTGCDNITSIEFEEGLTVIPSSMFEAMKGITEITIPDSVKTIEFCAFDNCTNLNKINFGNGVEIIGDYAFRGCTSLTSLKIPKSIKSKSGSIQGVFTGCDNITSIEFEDGLTVIPSCMFEAMKGITEITIPNSVETMEFKTFAYCTNLKKITILDNVAAISQYTFEGHNEDLTIYCYKDSVAHKHAVKYNIKYVLLERPTDPAPITNDTNPTTEKNDEPVITTEKKDERAVTTEKKDEIVVTTEKKDETVATTILPKTGLKFNIIMIIVVIAGIGVFSYKKFSSLKDIK